MPGKVRLRGLAVRISILLFAAYGYFHQRHFDAPTPASRLDLLHSIVTHHTFAIDNYDNTMDRAIWDGHYYSDKAPGVAFVALPAFVIGYYLLSALGTDPESPKGWLATSWFATAFSVGLITALGGGALFLLLTRLVRPPAAFLTAMTLFLGAAPFPYATQMFSHGMVVGLIAISAYLVHLLDPDLECSAKETFAGGCCAGLAVSSEFTAAVVVYGIVIAVLFRSLRGGLWFVCGMIVPLLLIPIYSLICFDSVWVIGYSHQASYEAMHEGLFGIGWPSFGNVWRLTFSCSRGLFVWTPFLLLSFFGFGAIQQRAPRLTPLLFAVPLLHVAVISGYFDWMAGRTIGPRYLAPILPLLAIPAALLVEKRLRVSVGLAILSVLITGTATVVNAAPERTACPLRDDSLPKLLAGEHAYTLGEMFGLNPHLSASGAILLIMTAIFWLWRECFACLTPSLAGEASDLHG